MRSTLDRSTLLEALDETPQTTERLARRLEAEPDEVQACLEEAEDDGLVADWGKLWATTWRAKLKLEPRFFKIWIPASLAAGALLTGTVAALNAPVEVRLELAGSMFAIATATAGLAAIGWSGGSNA